MKYEASTNMMKEVFLKVSLKGIDVIEPSELPSVIDVTELFLSTDDYDDRFSCDDPIETADYNSADGKHPEMGDVMLAWSLDESKMYEQYNASIPAEWLGIHSQQAADEYFTNIKKLSQQFLTA